MVFQARIFFDIQQVLVLDKVLERALAKRFMGFSSFAFQPFIQFIIQMPAILANSFKELFVSKKEGSLREWIENAITRESDLKGFAKGIASDFAAVNQAVVSAINNGQVEGQVNKLKTIKRKMHGRAGYPLLKQMVLNSG